MPSAARIAAILRSLHWRRGLRAGLAVAIAIIVCRLLHKPMGWAALGGFEATLVDNGGPYRSRLYTIATVLLGGALCGAIGSLVPTPLLIGIIVTAAVCFAVTFARVASQPIASTAVIILVIYFAGFGSTERTLHTALANVGAYILGGIGAAILSLFLWPVDPFRPARQEVAACYELLAAFTASLTQLSSPNHDAHDDDHTQATAFKRQLRARIESARAALSATAARAPVRTVRARNLSVLLETADMLFGLMVRLTELVEIAPHDPANTDIILDTAAWLSGAETAIANALLTKPADSAASFKPNGSHRIQFITRRAALLNPLASNTNPLANHLLAAQREALQNIEIAFEALLALWTGTDSRPGFIQTPGAPFIQQYRMSGIDEPAPPTTPTFLDALRQNWTLNSVMMRHALRTAVVGAVDVLLIHVFHLSHGYWLAMTSIIVLQPYSSGTVRRGLQRVAGTVAGGIFAAILAATIHSYTGIGIVITACAVLTLATYAVNYAWYAFFLTPTFVLLSLPYLRDWHVASMRIVTTLLGALAAVIAMRTLWPQSLRVELARLLARSASASASYVRAVQRLWQLPAADHKSAERTILAPARRACGLTSQDAEEALDRVMLEPGLPALASTRRFALETESALTFTTYNRRFVQCLTTLAAVGTPDPNTVARLESLTRRLAALCSQLDHQSDCAFTVTDHSASSTSTANSDSLAEQMLQRMERQLGVLERSAAVIVPRPAASTPEASATPLSTQQAS